jgi:hypothetical protein
MHPLGDPITGGFVRVPQAEHWGHHMARLSFRDLSEQLACPPASEGLPDHGTIARRKHEVFTFGDISASEAAAGMA